MRSIAFALVAISCIAILLRSRNNPGCAREYPVTVSRELERRREADARARAGDDGNSPGRL